MTVSKNGRDDLSSPRPNCGCCWSSEPAAGAGVSRQQLLRLVWEHDYLGDSRLVDACVQRLRAKIEDVPSAPTLIRTVRGVGYRFGPV